MVGQEEGEPVREAGSSRRMRSKAHGQQWTGKTEE